MFEHDYGLYAHVCCTYRGVSAPVRVQRISLHNSVKAVLRILFAFQLLVHIKGNPGAVRPTFIV